MTDNNSYKPGELFRDLRADEVEARVQRVTDKGVIVLLYKDARCDMRILDEALTPQRWTRDHYEIKGRLFCKVGIKFDDEWVYKSDCGVESNTEAEKGEASDSFKRACVTWGIGRELYTAPFIFVPADKVNITKTNNNKLVCYAKFSVSSMTVVDKRITALQLMADGKVVYEYPSKGRSEPTPAEAAPKPKMADRSQMEAINETCEKLHGLRNKTGKEWYEAAVKKTGAGKKLTEIDAGNVLGLLMTWVEKEYDRVALEQAEEMRKEAYSYANDAEMEFFHDDWGDR